MFENSKSVQIQDEMPPRDFIFLLLQLLDFAGREPICLLAGRIRSRAMAATSVSGAGSRSVIYSVFLSIESP